MLKFLKFFGMEPVVVRELESGLLVIFLSLFGLLTFHTIGLSIVIHFNRLANEADRAVPMGAEGQRGGFESLADAPPLETLMCKSKETNTNEGAPCR